MLAFITIWQFLIAIWQFLIRFFDSANSGSFWAQRFTITIIAIISAVCVSYVRSIVIPQYREKTKLRKYLRVLEVLDLLYTSEEPINQNLFEGSDLKAVISYVDPEVYLRFMKYLGSMNVIDSGNTKFVHYGTVLPDIEHGIDMHDYNIFSTSNRRSSK